MNTPALFKNTITVDANGKLITNGDASFNGNLFFVGASKIDNSGSLTMNTPAIFNNTITQNNSNFVMNNGITSMNNRKNEFYNNLIFESKDNTKMIVIGDASFNGRVYINTSYSNTSYSSSNNILSDYRIKSNVRELGVTRLSIDSLNPVMYTNNNTGKEDIGFIAHELQEYFPFLVNGEKDGETLQSVNYNGLIGILVRELQVLKKKVAQLEHQNVL